MQPPFRHKYSTKNSDYNLIGYNLCSVDKRGTASPLDTPALLQPSPLATAHAPALCHTFFLYFSHPKNTKKAGAVPPIFRPDSLNFFLTFPERFQQKFVPCSPDFLTSSRRKIFTHTQNIFSHCPSRSFLVLFNRGVGDSLRPVNPFIFFQGASLETLTIFLFDL